MWGSEGDGYNGSPFFTSKTDWYLIIWQSANDLNKLDNGNTDVSYAIYQFLFHILKRQIISITKKSSTNISTTL